MGDRATDRVDRQFSRAPAAGVFKLGDVLQLVIDEEMAFEAAKPAHRSLAPLRQAVKHPVAGKALIVAHRDGGTDDSE